MTLAVVGRVRPGFGRADRSMDLITILIVVLVIVAIVVIVRR